MRLHVTPCRKSIIGLTSLIDVIFLLLLFFMLTSTFLRYTGFDLSVAAASGDAPASETILLVHLNAVAGPDLTIEITEFHARGIEHAVLRPRGEVPVQLLVDTLEMLQSTELTSVSLAR